MVTKVTITLLPPHRNPNNDVYFARGNDALLAPGTKQYREIIRQLKKSYQKVQWQTGLKTRISQYVIDTIRSRGGEFFYCDECRDQKRSAPRWGCVSHKWIPVPPVALHAKVKQALRAKITPEEEKLSIPMFIENWRTDGVVPKSQRRNSLLYSVIENVHTSSHPSSLPPPSAHKIDVRAPVPSKLKNDGNLKQLHFNVAQEALSSNGVDMGKDEEGSNANVAQVLLQLARKT